jgi:hypothetical protein
MGSISFTESSYFHMLFFMGNPLHEGQIPQIWETEDEKCLSTKELKELCFAFVRQHFQGKIFTNKSINKPISVSRDGLEKWETVTKSRDQMLSVKILDSLLQNSSYWKEEPPQNNDPNLEKVIYLRQNCRINGNAYQAIITIKVYKANNYHKYYHYYLDDREAGLEK